MTSIDFYSHVDDPIAIVIRLVGRAMTPHGTVRVLTPDAATTDALDRKLWLLPATAFVPHCRLDSALASETPVIVDHVLTHEGGTNVLINLAPEPPPFFSRFERLLEIVATDENAVARGRERYLYYRKRGYPLAAHNMAGGA